MIIRAHDGIDCVCAHCSTSNTWEGNPLRLHVDHIDGDNTNHVISNIRLLCPNYHSQTSTYCGRNIKIKNAVRPVITSISPKHLELKIPRHCIECNKEIRAANKSGLCRDCCNKKQQKVSRPSKEHLINLLSNSSFLSISKQFNVSGNAIRKWCKQYGMNPKEYGRAGIIANKK